MQYKNIFISEHWHNYIPMKKITLNNETINLTLNIAEKLGFKVAEMAGEPIVQYNDIEPVPNFDRNQTQAILIEKLKQNAIDVLYFRNVKTDGQLYALLKNIGIITAHKKAPYINLENLNNLDDYLKTLSVATRKSKRRAIKKLEKNFQTHFQILKSESITDELFDEIINMKITQLSKQGQTSRLFVNPQNLEALKSLTLIPNNEFETIISTLRCDNELAAAEIGYVHNKTYYSFLGAMNLAFQPYGAGGIQLLKTIEWAIEAGHKKIDLLGPENGYKLSWSGGNSTEIVDIVLPIGLKGKIYGNIYIKILRPWLKKSYFFVKKYLG